MKTQMTNLQIDHLDPIWFEGEKEEEGYEQLICGLDIDPNKRPLDIIDNSRKSDRFLSWRVTGSDTPPTEKGDLCYFMVEGEWKYIEYLGEEWYSETTRTGRFHQSRQGRQSSQRRDGFIGWNERASEEELLLRSQRQSDSIKKRIEEKGYWGCMGSITSESAARMGAVSGPMSITEENRIHRERRQIIQRGDTYIECERGVIASRIVEMIHEVAPECYPMQARSIHNIWRGRTSKGWYLVSEEV